MSDQNAATRRSTPPEFLLSPSASTVSDEVYDRLVGVVVGAAAGDALGAPFEFEPQGTFERRFPERRSASAADMVGGGMFDWAPGEFTDDTQMGVALATSLLTCGRYDPDDVWSRWRRWAASARDVGVTTRHALRHEDWRDVTHPDPERTAANGPLMRAFPLAVSAWNSEHHRVRSVSVHQSWLTHAHPAAAWGAWLGVAMMLAGIRGDDVFTALEEEIGWLNVHDPGTAASFRPFLDKDWSPSHDGRQDVGNGSVWGCLAQAVWSLRRNHTFEDVITAVVDLGDDTDTVACVAGAIAGARAGAGAIPSGWTEKLHGVVAAPEGVSRFEHRNLVDLAVRLGSHG